MSEVLLRHRQRSGVRTTGTVGVVRLGEDGKSARIGTVGTHAVPLDMGCPVQQRASGTVTLDNEQHVMKLRISLL